MKKPRKKRPKVLHLYEETWGQNVYILHPATSADLTAFVKRQFGEDYKGTEGFAGRCLHVPSSEGGQIVIGLYRWAFNPSIVASLTHECFHAVEYILEARGMRHTKATSEAYAYLLGSLVRQSIRLLQPTP